MFSNCRDYLLKTVSFKTIFPNLANVFIEASVDTLIFIAKKTVSDSIIKISKFNNQNPIIDHLVDQKRFEKNDKYIFDVETNNEFYSIIQKVRQKSNILQDVAEITRGVNPYDKYRGQDEEIIKNKAYLLQQKKIKHLSLKLEENMLTAILILGMENIISVMVTGLLPQERRSFFKVQE
jgi:hypothetical protein